MVKFTTTQPTGALSIQFSKFGLSGLSMDTMRKALKCLHNIRQAILPTEEALQLKSTELAMLSEQIKEGGLTPEIMAQVKAANTEMVKGNKSLIEVETMAENATALCEALKKIDWSSAELKDKFEGSQMLAVEELINALEEAK